MIQRYWLDVRDKPGVLRVVMRALAGQARISFEGDLSHCKGLFEIPGATGEGTAVLERQTIHPKQDFVVIPLENTTVDPIMNAVEPDGRIVRDVCHVQIEKGGILQFGAYDKFHHDGCVVWWGADDATLSELRAKGMLRSFQLAPDRGAGA